MTLMVTSTQTRARCPVCDQESGHIHSHYQRTVTDLPCADMSMRLQLNVRKFFCHNGACERVIFTERLPGLVTPWARRTQRLLAEQRWMGLQIGGEPGARLSIRLHMGVSADTLLRLVRRGDVPEVGPTHVLGVDDWAHRKGQTYGTILVNLEDHRVVDLLPDRSSDSLAQWLQDHPGVEVITRDRAQVYAEGATRGAPEATQVADRFHLLVNLRGVVERLLERHQAALQATILEPDAEAPSNGAEPQTGAVNMAEAAAPEPDALSTSKEPVATGNEPVRDRRRARRQARYEQVMALRQQGMGIRAIARHLGVSRRTVHRYVRADGFPEMAQRRKARSMLDPYKAYLHQQMAAGHDNGMQLWREVRDQGYSGSRVLVSRWVAQHRHLCPASKNSVSPKRRGRPPAPPRPQAAPHPLSARQASWLLVAQPEKLTDEERIKVGRLCQASADVARGYDLGQAFARAVRKQQADPLDSWLSSARDSGLPDFARFAAGIERDRDAVIGALSLPWSNGQTEGQVNRLKLIKRQMYGRANFDLLRQRVLAA